MRRKMSPELGVQLFINGVVVGMIYVLVALGLNLLLGVAGIFNFAHGDFYMLGAYTLFATYSVFHLNYGLALVITTIVIALFGAICYRLVFHRIRTSVLLCLVASVGMGLVFEQGALVGFGTTQRGMPTVFQGIISIGDITLPQERLVVILLSLVVMLALYFIIMKTKIGKAIRAVSSDIDAASLQGISSGWIFLIVMAMGCALAGIAGGIIAPVYAVYPMMGENMLMMILIIIILGGLGSMPGAIVGGLLIGMMHSFGSHFFSGLQTLLMLFCVGVILVFKPWGIFGHEH
jgi:branched-chain amino acid transport system permease protein